MEKRKVRIRSDAFLFWAQISYAVFLVWAIWLAGRVSQGFQWATIFIGALLLLFLNRVALQEPRRQRRILLSGEKVDGHVIEVESGKGARIKVAYSIEGKNYSGWSYSLSALRVFLLPVPRQFKEGDRVTLFVDPNDLSSFVVYEISSYDFV